MADATETQARPMTAFISGPIEPPDIYFQTHYKSPILEAIAAGHSFVMGPAPGMDTKALHFLVNEGVNPARITVYFAQFQEALMEEDIRWFVELGGNIKVEGGTTGQRDAAMTRDSDYDILRYMTIEEQKEFYGDLYYFRISNTEKNERRRKGLPLHDFHPLVDHPDTNKKQGETTHGPKKGVKKFLNGIFGQS